MTPCLAGENRWLHAVGNGLNSHPIPRLLLRFPNIDSLLKIQPKVWRCIECARQPQRHINRDRGTSVHNGGDRLAGNAYTFGKCRNTQPQRLKIHFLEYIARQGRLSCSFHITPTSMVVLIIDNVGISILKAKRQSPVAGERHAPESSKITLGFTPERL